MSKDTERSTDLALPADPVESLKTRVQRLQLLVLALAACCVMALALAGSTLAMLLSDNKELAAVEQAELEQKQQLTSRWRFSTRRSRPCWLAPRNWAPS